MQFIKRVHGTMGSCVNGCVHVAQHHVYTSVLANSTGKSPPCGTRLAHVPWVMIFVAVQASLLLLALPAFRRIPTRPTTDRVCTVCKGLRTQCWRRRDPKPCLGVVFDRIIRQQVWEVVDGVAIMPGPSALCPCDAPVATLHKILGNNDGL